MLHHQVAWYVGGPLLGLCVVLMRALVNVRLGVTGGFSSFVEQARARRLDIDWRAAFLIGVIAGAVAFSLLSGGRLFHGYGWLTQTFTGSARFLVGVILLVAGMLIGFGAKTARGCTSGNGLSGTSMFSPASLAATATFFATAIAVSFAIKAVI